MKKEVSNIDEMMDAGSEISNSGAEGTPEKCKCPECGYMGGKEEFESEDSAEPEGEEMDDKKKEPNGIALSIILDAAKKMKNPKAEMAK